MSVLVVAQSSSEIPEGLMNSPVYTTCQDLNLMWFSVVISGFELSIAASNTVNGAALVLKVVLRILI